MRNYIRQGVAEGAKLVTGGAESPDALEQGYFVRPTVFSDVRSAMTIAQEEIFGPVLVILPYDDEEQAIRIANDTIYGSGGRRVVGRPRARASAWRGGCARARSRSTAARSIRWRRLGATNNPGMAASWANTASRSS